MKEILLINMDDVISDTLNHIINLLKNDRNIIVDKKALIGDSVWRYLLSDKALKQFLRFRILNSLLIFVNFRNLRV